MTEKQKLEFSTQLSLDKINENNDLVELDRSTLLVPGTHNGVKFPEDEIKNMDFSDSFPLNMDHNRDIVAEVGFWQNPAIENDELRADPVLNKQTAAFDAAMGYVQNRQAMDGTAEVSIEVFGVPDKNEDGEDIFTDLELDKAALVDRGAVSPDKGAGIGMNMSDSDNAFTWIIDGDEVKYGVENDDGTIIPVQNINATDNTLQDLEDFEWSNPDLNSETPDLEDKNMEVIKEVDLYVPNNPDDYGTSEAEWEAPTLSDFTDESFDDLDESEKREIAAHFAFSENNPPENYGDLKLPHHDPSTSNAVWNGVVAAMAALSGARGGADIPNDDESAVYSHLAAHYRDDFDEEPPSKDDVLSEEEHPEEFENDTVEIDKETYDDLQSEVIRLRNEVQDLEEKLGEKWAEKIEKNERTTSGRKTAVNGDSIREDERSLVRKYLEGEFGEDTSLIDVIKTHQPRSPL